GCLAVPLPGFAGVGANSENWGLEKTPRAQEGRLKDPLRPFSWLPEFLRCAGEHPSAASRFRNHFAAASSSRSSTNQRSTRSRAQGGLTQHGTIAFLHC